MAAVTVLLRTVSVFFGAFVAGKLGAAGMGLYSLVLSVYGLFSTFASSGVNFTVSRMTADALGHRSGAEVYAVLRRCLAYAAAFGISAALLMYVSSGAIGCYLLDDPRTVPALRALAPGLLPMAVNTAFHGYFQAVRRSPKSAAVMLCEQGVRIAVTAAALSVLLPYGIGPACCAVGTGVAVSELAAFLLGVVLCRRDLSRHIEKSGKVPYRLTEKMFSISLPISLSAYLRSGLLTLEHMLIPKGLKKFGSGSEEALATYGILSGMAFPIVLYPLTILQSITSLLLPEIAEAKAAGDEKLIRRTALRVFRITLLFSLGTAGVMFSFSDALGKVLYSSPDAGRFIRMISPLIPVMYLDSAVDAMLKGLGEHIYTMRVNIVDSFLSVILVWSLLSVKGVEGYIFTVYLTEIINASLSIGRLIIKAGIRPDLLRWFVIPGGCVCATVFASRSVFCAPALLVFASTHPVLLLTVGCTFFAALYFLLLRLFGSLRRGEIKAVCVKLTA